MIVGVPRETAAGERRVALVPDLAQKLVQAKLDVVVQTGAGSEAGFLDAAYRDKGARIDPEVFAQADVLLKIGRASCRERV